MPKEQGEEAGGKEVCRYQIKESDKEEVGDTVGKVFGCFLNYMSFQGGFWSVGIGLRDYIPGLQGCGWRSRECEDGHSINLPL